MSKPTKIAALAPGVVEMKIMDLVTVTVSGTSSTTASATATPPELQGDKLFALAGFAIPSGSDTNTGPRNEFRKLARQPDKFCDALAKYKKDIDKVCYGATDLEPADIAFVEGFLFVQKCDAASGDWTDQELIDMLKRIVFSDGGPTP